MKIAFLSYFFIVCCFCIEMRGLITISDCADIVKQYHKKVAKNAILDDVLLYPDVGNGTGDKMVKRGQFVHYPNAKANVIICHGFSCDHHDVVVLRHIFDSGDYNVLSFDFRAHGELIGENDVAQYCTFGKDETHDLRAAIDFLTYYPDTFVSKKPIFIYGFSMGAVVAIETAVDRQDKIKGLILDCPFESSEEVVKRGVEDISIEIFGYKINCPGISILKEYVFHPYVQGVVKRVLKTISNLDTKDIATDLHPVYPIQTIESISIPVLFIHCKNDKKIPLDAVVSLYNKAPGYKRLWVTGGRGHFGSYFYCPETYKVVVCSFLSMLINKEGALDEKSEGIFFDDVEGISNKQVITRLGFK